MRKYLIALAIVLVLPLVATARPFLICDPQVGVIEYEVTIEENGIPVIGGIIAAEADTTLRYDLAGISNGTYNARVRAGNLWGWSDWSLPFGFVVERCGDPTGVVIVP